MLSLPPDDAALVTAVAFHVKVAIVGNGKDVRGHLPNLLVGILADVLWRIDGEQLVGVHSHQDGAGVCLWITKTRELTTPSMGGSDSKVLRFRLLRPSGRDSTGCGVTWLWARILPPCDLRTGLQTSVGSG